MEKYYKVDIYNNIIYDEVSYKQNGTDTKTKKGELL